MANNRIQIKRSATTATPSSLLPGELAFSNATGGSGVLFIGDTSNTTVVAIGGVRNPGTLTANQALVANSTSGIDKVIVANLVANSIWANGAAGSAGHTLFSNGSAIYWAAPAAGGGITEVVAGNGLTGGGSSGSVTVDVGAGNGISVSADAVAVLGNTGVTVNSSGVFIGQAVGTTSSVTFANVVTTDITVNGNTKLGDSTSDVVEFVARVNTAIVPSANQTYDLGSNLLRWNNIYGNTLTITGTSSLGGNVQIDGTLTVVGNVVTTNVQSVIVSDPMIYLAGNNYTSDLLDIGIAANYNDGVTNRHTGFFRDHTDGIWKLFTNLTQELSGNNDVDTSDASYRIASLQSYLFSSGLTTNSGSVYVTANSTVNVNISANVLTLSGRANNDLLFTNSTGGITGLALNTTAGYVLQSNGTAIVYDWIDGGTF